MLWFYFALLSVIGIAISNIFRRILMKDDKSDAIASSILFNFIQVIFFISIAFFHGFTLPPITQYPLNFLFQAVCWGLANLFVFKASQHLEASETTIIMTLASVVTIVTAVLFLHEHFGFMYLIGAVLIVFSISYISYQPKKVKVNKGVLYALAYCLVAGIGATNDAFILHRADALSYLIFASLNPGLFLLLIKPTALTKMKPLLQRSTFLKLFILTFFYSFAAAAYFLAINVGGQASQVAPISEASIILTILIAALFLNERDHLIKKILCVVLVTIGVFLLS